MSPATFGGLLTDALTELEGVTGILTTSPAARTTTPRAAVMLPLLDDVAAALHTLGRTIGDTDNTGELHHTLNRPPLPFATHNTTEPGLARAATTIRAAAELLATTGPLHPDPATPQPPRATHLTNNQSRAGAWQAIATLTKQLAHIAHTTNTPTGTQLAHTWSQAAATIPATGMPEILIITTTPQTDQGLTSHIHTLTNIAHQAANPTPLQPTSIGTLKQLASFATTTYNASAKASPTHTHAYQQRAKQWARIHAALSALRTPTTHTPTNHTTTTLAALAHLNHEPSPNDLTRARAATCQIAPLISQALKQMTHEQTIIAIGELIPPLIAATTTNLTQAKTNKQTTTVHPADLRLIHVGLSHTAKPTTPDTKRVITLETLNQATTTTTNRRR